MKKIISILLSLMLVFSISTGITLTANAGTTLYWPVPGHLGLSAGFHDGNAIDISDNGISGAKVIAAIDGTVTHKFTCTQQHYGSFHNCNGFGTGIVVKGTDGRIYQYAHLQGGSIPSNVYVGATVKAGQEVGKVGTTGNSSGYHLHFAISYNNYWEAGVNPQNETYNYSDPNTVKPVKISNVKVTEVNVKGYTIQCTIENASKVTFPTWYKKSGVSSAKDYSGTKSGNTYTFKFTGATQDGLYATHIHMWDAGGKYTNYTSLPAIKVIHTTRVPAVNTAWLNNKLYGSFNSNFDDIDTVFSSKLRLAEPKTETERNLVKNLVTGGSKEFYLIGAVKSGSSWKWKYSGTTIPSSTLSGLWGSGEPNNSGGNENCISISKSTGKWNDSSYDAENCGFIAELDLTSLKPYTTKIWHGHKYVYYQEHLPYTFANKVCQAYGGDLVSIIDQAENATVQSLLPYEQSAFIGLNDIEKEGTFIWTDGTSSSYRNWDGSPDNYSQNGGQDYVRIYGSSGKWDDANDIKTNGKKQVSGFICEFVPKYDLKLNKTGLSEITVNDVDVTIKYPDGTTYDAKKYSDIKIKVEKLDGNQYKVSVTPDPIGTFSVGTTTTFSTEEVHNYTEKITKAPTCTENGIKTFTCQNCGDSYTEEIAMTDHTPTADKAIEATCTSTGLTAGSHCSVCNKVITEQKVIEKTAHVWDKGKVTKSATETETGIITYTCSNCGTTKTAEIAKTEHVHSYSHVVTQPTCTTLGYTTHTCSGCGDSYVDSYTDKLAHSFEKIATYPGTCVSKELIVYRCKNCGYNKVETGDYDKNNHSSAYLEPVDDIAPTCQSAGKANGYHCLECGATFYNQEVEPIDHLYTGKVITESTCTDQGETKYTCSMCSDSFTTYEPLLEHSYENGVCVNCGETETESDIIKIKLDVPEKVTISSNPDEYSRNAFIFTAEEAGTYVFGAEGDYDSVIDIYNENDELLKHSDDVGFSLEYGNNFRASIDLEANQTVRLVCSVYDESVDPYAEYTLTAEKHTHSITEIKDVYDECADLILVTKYCQYCDEKQYSYEDGNGHTINFRGVKAKPNKDGYYEAYCDDCNEVLSHTVIPAPSVIVLSATRYTYNGNAKKPSVTVYDSDGNEMVKGVDFTVKYQKGRVEIGKYAVKITYSGYYSGSQLVYFTIVPKGTTISSLTRASKAFTVKWKKQATQTSGYQIQYSTSKNFKSYTTITVSSSKTTTKKISKLKKNKTYYVRVRTYKTVKIDGKNKNIASSWSKVKSVKTK